VINEAALRTWQHLMGSGIPPPLLSFGNVEKFERYTAYPVPDPKKKTGEVDLYHPDPTMLQYLSLICPRVSAPPSQDNPVGHDEGW